MRLHYGLLLAAVILFASVNTGSASTSSDFRGMAAEQNNAPTKRLLRTTHDGDEERALPGLTKLTQVVSGAKNNFKIQSWLKNQKSLDDVFTKLRLDKAGDNLLNEPQFKTWVKYMQTYNKKNGLEDSSGLSIVSKYFTDDKRLSAMIEAARKKPSTARIGNDLRVDQLRQWMREQKHPRDVFALLNVKGTTLDDVNRKFWKEYLVEYNRIYIQRRPRRS
ncbi:hypothetical protein PRIC2_014611 [Phytophthora ramorum]|uniref:RxLR effector protein PexRD25 n=1 Tax=Phytophthora ramorum TaxID=164328 RepID=UPI003096D455|nr:RxLR effector protein PexRD25 [Phytophthora ramorum]